MAEIPGAPYVVRYFSNAGQESNGETRDSCASTYRAGRGSARHRASRAHLRASQQTNRRCSNLLLPVDSIVARSADDASFRNHSSQWLPIPWSGLRSSASDRKPSVLQCQNVQNQTKPNVCSRRNSRPSGVDCHGAKDEAKRHLIRHLQCFPGRCELLG